MRIKVRKHAAYESGQSIMELALLLPIYLGLMFYLIQSTMAINGGIVYQQFAREKLFGLFFNHRDYPRLFTTTKKPAGNQAGWQRFWVGIDEDTWYTGETGDRVSQAEIAPKVRAGFSEAEASTDLDEGFPADTRKRIRVRIKAFICVGPKFLPVGNSGSSAAQNAPFLSDMSVMNDRTFRDGAFKLCNPSD